MINTRERFRAKGDLWPCPNKAHDFKIGKLIGQWQWAADCWSDVTEGVDGEAGKLVNYGLFIGTITSIEDRVAYKIVVWKFRLIFAFLT